MQLLFARGRNWLIPRDSFCLNDKYKAINCWTRQCQTNGEFPKKGENRRNSEIILPTLNAPTEHASYLLRWSCDFAGERRHMLDRRHRISDEPEASPRETRCGRRRCRERWSHRSATAAATRRASPVSPLFPQSLARTSPISSAAMCSLNDRPGTCGIPRTSHVWNTRPSWPERYTSKSSYWQLYQY